MQISEYLSIPDFVKQAKEHASSTLEVYNKFQEISDLYRGLILKDTKSYQNFIKEDLPRLEYALQKVQEFYTHQLFWHVENQICIILTALSLSVFVICHLFPQFIPFILKNSNKNQQNESNTNSSLDPLKIKHISLDLALLGGVFYLSSIAIGRIQEVGILFCLENVLTTDLLKKRKDIAALFNC